MFFYNFHDYDNDDDVVVGDDDDFCECCWEQNKVLVVIFLFYIHLSLVFVVSHPNMGTIMMMMIFKASITATQLDTVAVVMQSKSEKLFFLFTTFFVPKETHDFAVKSSSLEKY